MTEPPASTTDVEAEVTPPSAGDDPTGAGAPRDREDVVPALAPTAPSRPRRSWVSATTVAVAVIAVVVASAVGVLAFTTDDGAATPEEAARRMLDAVERNDLVGMVEHLPPGERRALRDPVTQLTTELQRLRLIGATDPHQVLGPILSFDDVQLRTTSLSEEVIAVDLVGGRFTAEWPGDGPPLTADARTLLDEYWDITVDPSNSTFTRDFGRDNLRLVTIDDGGGWHVSLAYSAAEVMRAGSGQPELRIGEGEGPRGDVYGASTPAAAVEDLVASYADADPDRLVRLVNPAERRVLTDFAPAFLPGARQAAVEAQEDGTYDVQLNELQTAVEGSGDRRQVTITALDIDIRDELSKQHLWFEDGCFHADRRVGDDDEPFAKTDTCSKDKPRAGNVTAPRDNPVAALSLFGGGADLPTFTVIERDGRWFVSPSETLLGSLVATVRTLYDEHDTRGYAERLAAAWKGRADDGLSGDLVRPTADEVREDPAKAPERGRALAAACAELASGDRADQVTTACLRRLIALDRIRAEDLPADARARLT